MENASEQWIRATIEEKWKVRRDEVGQFNLAIFGRTGVGKSTLLNAIFGEKIAETGIGQPVTRGHHLYNHSRGALGVFDIQGLELGQDDGKLLAELAELVSGLRQKPISEQIHVAWFCVRSRDGRFEDFEEAFVKRLHELRLPVLLVLTQVPTRDGEPHERVVELADHITGLGLPIVDGRPFLTMAEPDSFDGPAHGLKEVLDATFRVAPDAVREALIQAQQIDMTRKRQSCEDAVKVAAGAAAAAGASPIPFSDAAILVPLQLGLLTRIAMVYDIEFDKATGMALAMTAVTTTGGRTLVTNLIKFLPGAGTFVGGAISAGVASSITLAMGWAWITVCEKIATGKLSRDVLLDANLLKSIFFDEFKGQARKRLPKGS